MADANPMGPYTYKKITESGVITTAGVGGYLKAAGMTVTTNASELVLRDGGASGAVILELHSDGATAKGTVTSGDVGPVRAETDIYAALTGTGAEAWVIYNQDSE
jgi:hypothetical protein